MDKKLLYYAGMGSVIAYLLADIIGGIITPNYSYIVNAISELSQSGAENRMLISSLFFLSAIMGILFTIGIISKHPHKQSKLIFIGGILLIVMEIFSALTGTIFPMDPIGVETTFAGTMHLVLVGIDAVLIFPALLMIGTGFYREKNWKSFRSYTFTSLLIIFIFGVLSAVVIVNGIELMGLVARVTIYTYLLWIFVLAYKLIMEKPEQVRNSDGEEAGNISAWDGDMKAIVYEKFGPPDVICHSLYGCE
jgi:uncharacterized protein DUF998